MIKNEYTKQTEFETVVIEQLVPQDHILRKIEENYDFSFVRKHMEHLYCPNNGRPAIDPVLLFKMLFIGYVFGIRSERQLEKEVQVNVAYRWFLNLNLTDRFPITPPSARIAEDVLMGQMYSGSCSMKWCSMPMITTSLKARYYIQTQPT